MTLGQTGLCKKSMSSSSFLPSRSSATQRKTAHTSSANATTNGPPGPALEQAPNPKPLFQFIAFGIIVFLGLLQFLPATHFRHPSDPFRIWVPFNPNTSLSKTRDSGTGAGLIPSIGQADGAVHIVSWMECLDLRLLAVLVNSTLSASRNPDVLHFHLFVPKGKEDKVSFYKLKVLFPHSNLEFYGQDEVKEVIRNASIGFEYSVQNLEEIVPFIISSVHLSLRKFTYISSRVIVKGRIEELIGVDLDTYAVSAAEDCSQKLYSSVNPDVLDAIQKSASKPWVSETPYALNSCMPDLSLLLIDGRKLEKYFLQAFLWWTKVLNWHDRRSSGRNPAIGLTLHNRYLKLPSSWLVKDSTPSVANESLAIHYDGPITVCSEFGGGATTEPARGDFWKEHLPPLCDQMVGS